MLNIREIGSARSGFPRLFKHVLLLTNCNRRGQRCGHGKMAYYGGQIYVGEWRDGVRSGFGTYTAPDGSVFEGFYEEDLKHGAGALRGIGDESITCQRWEKGRLVTAGQSQICSDTPR